MLACQPLPLRGEPLGPGDRGREGGGGFLGGRDTAALTCPFVSLPEVCGPRAGSRAGRRLDAPGPEMAGNCSWETRPGGRDEASASGRQGGSGRWWAGCGGSSRTRPGPPPPASAAQAQPLSKDGWAALVTSPPRSPVSSSVSQARGPKPPVPPCAEPASHCHLALSLPRGDGWSAIPHGQALPGGPERLLRGGAAVLCPHGARSGSPCEARVWWSGHQPGPRL